MTPRPLVLGGAGGFARETAELVAAINEREPTWELLGFLDDDPAMHGRSFGGIEIIGPMDWLCDHDAAAVICVGNPRNYTSRARIVERLALDDERYATLVHPAAVVPRSTTLGVGTVVHAITVATGHSSVGDHVAIMPSVVITHDDVIDDFATIGAGVRFAGGVHVGTGAYVGSGALVRENVTIGSWALVGMGAVVTRPVPGNEVWTGNPARFRRSADQQIDPRPVEPSRETISTTTPHHGEHS